QVTWLVEMRGNDLVRVAVADLRLADSHHLLVTLLRRKTGELPLVTTGRRDVRDGFGERPCDLLRVPGEHIGDPGAVVETHERVRDDERALRKTGARVGERHRR